MQQILRHDNVFEDLLQWFVLFAQPLQQVMSQFGGLLPIKNQLHDGQSSLSITCHDAFEPRLALLELGRIDQSGDFCHEPLGFLTVIGDQLQHQVLDVAGVSGVGELDSEPPEQGKQALLAVVGIPQTEIVEVLELAVEQEIAIGFLDQQPQLASVVKQQEVVLVVGQGDPQSRSAIANLDPAFLPFGLVQPHLGQILALDHAVEFGGDQVAFVVIVAGDGRVATVVADRLADLVTNVVGRLVVGRDIGAEDAFFEGQLDQLVVGGPDLFENLLGLSDADARDRRQRVRLLVILSCCVGRWGLAPGDSGPARV